MTPERPETRVANEDRSRSRHDRHRAESGGLGGWVFARIRPRDARAVAVRATALELTGATGPQLLAMANIRAITAVREFIWSGVQIRTDRDEVRVSGLKRRDAVAVAAAARYALRAWWTEHLREHAETVKRIQERLDGLERPMAHVRPAAFASLLKQIEEEASPLPAGWPKDVDAEPAAKAIDRIHAFLAQPETARERANAIWAVSRTDALLDGLKRPARYVRSRAFAALSRKAKRAPGALPRWWPGQSDPQPTVQALKRIAAFLADPDAVRERANSSFLEAELKRGKTFLDKVETRPLSAEQRRAACIDDDRNLVVAAAGSGKTSVMVAKAGWMVERGDRKPEEVLLLAFARNARDELAERVARRLGRAASSRMRVATFHSVGLSIIAEAEDRKPALAKSAGDEGALFDRLKEIVEELTNHPEHGRDLIRWLSYDARPQRSTHTFESLEEYQRYLRTHELRALQGEKVKSVEECVIANFLYLNGVPYEYERPYEHDTATRESRQYAPDFHLSEAGIYIEHFALSKDGGTPPFIDRAEYTAAREWKIRLHRRHGTTLVETFSHEQTAGRLTESLAEKLRAHGVALKPLPRKRIFAALESQGRVPPLIQLAASFLQHVKGGRLSKETIEERLGGRGATHRSRVFLRLFGAIFDRYEARLASAGEIDFHDMINRAAEHVAAGRWQSPFRYILVDEFQDISQGRATLLKALLDQAPGAQLFAVGDDWQAIYRFAGADVSVMRDFGRHFGAGTRTDLETTFRCSDGLSEIAVRFVCRNPEQIGKKVRAISRVIGPGVRICPAGRRADDALERTLELIASEAAASERRPTVLLLGRYRHAGPEMGALRRKHSGLELAYRTVHAAKGLEADYAVIVGMHAGTYGFPNEIADDPLLERLLARAGEYPAAEERRLLYVALTRAKWRTYLIDEKPRSGFVDELLQPETGAEALAAAPSERNPVSRDAGGRARKPAGPAGRAGE